MNVCVLCRLVWVWVCRWGADCCGCGDDGVFTSGEEKKGLTPYEKKWLSELRFFPGFATNSISGDVDMFETRNLVNHTKTSCVLRFW